MRAVKCEDESLRINIILPHTFVEAVSAVKSVITFVGRKMPVFTIKSYACPCNSVGESSHCPTEVLLVIIIFFRGIITKDYVVLCAG